MQAKIQYRDILYLILLYKLMEFLEPENIQFVLLRHAMTHLHKTDEFVGKRISYGSSADRMTRRRLESARLIVADNKPAFTEQGKAFAESIAQLPYSSLPTQLGINTDNMFVDFMILNNTEYDLYLSITHLGEWLNEHQRD